jgi:hypothetical protein
LSGAGFAEVKAEAPCLWDGHGCGGRYHRDKFLAYRATLFLTHCIRRAMIPAQEGSNAMRKI